MKVIPVSCKYPLSHHERKCAGKRLAHTGMGRAELPGMWTGASSLCYSWVCMNHKDASVSLVYRESSKLQRCYSSQRLAQGLWSPCKITGVEESRANLWFCSCVSRFNWEAVRPGAKAHTQRAKSSETQGQIVGLFSPLLLFSPPPPPPLRRRLRSPQFLARSKICPWVSEDASETKHCMVRGALASNEADCSSCPERLWNTKKRNLAQQSEKLLWDGDERMSQSQNRASWPEVANSAPCGPEDIWEISNSRTPRTTKSKGANSWSSLQKCQCLVRMRRRLQVKDNTVSKFNVMVEECFAWPQSGIRINARNAFRFSFLSANRASPSGFGPLGRFNASVKRHISNVCHFIRMPLSDQRWNSQYRRWADFPDKANNQQFMNEIAHPEKMDHVYFSPLSVDCRPTVGWPSADSLPTVGRQPPDGSTDSRPTFCHRQSTDGRPTVGGEDDRRSTVWCLSQLHHENEDVFHSWDGTEGFLAKAHWPTVIRLSTDCRSTVGWLRVARLSVDSRPIGRPTDLSTDSRTCPLISCLMSDNHEQSPILARVT